MTARIKVLFAVIVVLMTASVLVFLTTKEPQVTSAPDCPKDSNLARCLSDWGVRNIEDLPTVMSVLTEYTVSDKEFGAVACHDTWHDVGYAAGERYSIVEALSLWPYSCAGGFLHGVMMSGAPQLDAAEFSAAARDICAPFTTRQEVIYLDCWHGIGHGLAELYAFPESMYECQGITSTGPEYDWCTWGAAEGYAADFIQDKNLQGQLAANLPGMCPSLSQATATCFRAVIPMLYNIGWSFEKMYDYCADLQESLRSECAYSAGQILGTLWVVDKASAAECSRHEDLESDCASGAGKYIGRVSEWGSLVLDAVSADKLAGICPEFSGPSRSSCESSYSTIRSLELSPEESLMITLDWYSN